MQPALRNAVKQANAKHLTSRARKAQWDMQRFTIHRIRDLLDKGPPLEPSTLTHALFHAWHDQVDADRRVGGYATLPRRRSCNGTTCVEPKP